MNKIQCCKAKVENCAICRYYSGSNFMPCKKTQEGCHYKFSIKKWFDAVRNIRRAI